MRGPYLLSRAYVSSNFRQFSIFAIITVFLYLIILFLLSDKNSIKANDAIPKKKQLEAVKKQINVKGKEIQKKSQKDLTSRNDRNGKTENKLNGVNKNSKVIKVHETNVIETAKNKKSKVGFTDDNSSWLKPKKEKNKLLESSDENEDESLENSDNDTSDEDEIDDYGEEEKSDDSENGEEEEDSESEGDENTKNKNKSKAKVGLFIIPEVNNNTNGCFSLTSKQILWATSCIVQKTLQVLPQLVWPSDSLAVILGR